MTDMASPALQILARSLLIYVGVLVGLRLMGKRELGQMTVFDLLVVLLIANAVQNPIVDADVSIQGGLLAAGVVEHRDFRALSSFLASQGSSDEAWAQQARVVEQLEGRSPDAAALLSDAAHDVLAFTAFPQTHWRQIWSNNPLERLNREVRRRTDVVGNFPNRPAIIRLVGAVLAEQHDEWAVARRYMSIESLAKAPGDLGGGPPGTRARS